MGDDLRYSDIYSHLLVSNEPMRSCGCYPYPVYTRAHWPGCEFYEVEHDPHRQVRWKVHKMTDFIDPEDPTTPWWVCQVRAGNGYHADQFRAKTWEDARIWLAVEYGRRRRQRRALETYMGITLRKV